MGGLRMLKRILFICIMMATLSGCVYVKGLQGQTTSNGYPIRNMAEQDPYLQRFYELEREIERLRSSNARLQRRLSSIGPTERSTASPIHTVDDAITPTASGFADDILGRVREQTDRALVALDHAMARLAEAPIISPTSSADIHGQLIRNADGEVISQTTQSESRKARYNYSVVYVYPDPQPWNEMWERLEAANEKDKWRGSNRNRYFIYVGAYYNQRDAEQRQQALFSLLGERPDMRIREQNILVAQNTEAKL